MTYLRLWNTKGEEQLYLFIFSKVLKVQQQKKKKNFGSPKIIKTK